MVLQINAMTFKRPIDFVETDMPIIKLIWNFQGLSNQNQQSLKRIE